MRRFAKAYAARFLQSTGGVHSTKVPCQSYALSKWTVAATWPSMLRRLLLPGAGLA
jgi:hypothetical protein